MRIPIILAIAALGLAGCNANQGVNLSSQTAPGVVRRPLSVTAVGTSLNRVFTEVGNTLK